LAGSARLRQDKSDLEEQMEANKVSFKEEVRLGTRNPDPETRDQKTETRNLGPETKNPKPETRKPKH